MLQRITDLWPGLVRRVRRGNDDEEPLLDNEEEQSSEDDPLAVDENQLLEDYQNLYWTRLMRIEDFE